MITFYNWEYSFVQVGVVPVADALYTRGVDGADYHGSSGVRNVRPVWGLAPQQVVGASAVTASWDAHSRHVSWIPVGPNRAGVKTRISTGWFWDIHAWPNDAVEEIKRPRRMLSVLQSDDIPEHVL